MSIFGRGLPSGPFYLGVPREDGIPFAPMSDTSDGLDFPAPARKPVGSPTLQPGSTLGTLQHLTDQPTSLGLYPMRIYELRVTGLRRVDADKRLVGEAVVDHEVPPWRYFGDHGDGVPEVLEAIWALDPERVARLVLPPGKHEWGHMPIPLLDAPKDHAGVRNAASAVETWTENASWAKGQGGGFYYRGCYFVYIVSDPQWLMAMGLAYNAAVAIASGPLVATEVREAVLDAWADLTG